MPHARTIVAILLAVMFCGSSLAQDASTLRRSPGPSRDGVRESYSFYSNGDFISGWFWLRDRRLNQYAEWTLHGLPGGDKPVTLLLHALATNRAGGGRGFDAKFRLFYGVPGARETDSRVVVLPNTPAPDDPAGYTCRGSLLIPRAALRGGNALYVRVERIDPLDSHVAFKETSVAVEGYGDPRFPGPVGRVDDDRGRRGDDDRRGRDDDRRDRDDDRRGRDGRDDGLRASDFDSNGEFLSGWYWLRDVRLNHFAEWEFRGLPGGAGSMTFEITALVDERPKGGRPDRTEILILFGSPGSSRLESRKVVLHQVKEDRGPADRFRGTLSIPRIRPSAPGNALRLIAKRIDGKGDQVAFRRESIQLTD